MKIYHDLSLSKLSTMHLGGVAANVTTAHSRQELSEAASWAKQKNLPIVVVGHGSNIIWQDSGFDGLVIINKITGYQIQSNHQTTYLTVGAGEIWDNVVAKSVADKLTGIEALSLIPGTAGATPVQNVGAYGQEISQSLVSLEALDTYSGKFVTIDNKDCGFSYRNSRFKSGSDRGRFLIASIKLQLNSGNPSEPFYTSVAQYFKDYKITSPRPADLRNAVMVIRSAKLPDPKKVNNCGSFFGNPIVDGEVLAEIENNFGACPHWNLQDGQVKLSAAWLIEQAGFKNYHDESTGMSTWPTQPLVFVNESASLTADLLKFKRKITEKVFQKFQVKLEQEPELLPKI